MALLDPRAYDDVYRKSLPGGFEWLMMMMMMKFNNDVIANTFWVLRTYLTDRIIKV